MYIVKYDESAFVSMVMNSLETFFLPMGNSVRGKQIKKGNIGHEIFGHLFGTLEKDRRNSIYTIKNCNIATTAKTTKESTFVSTDIFFVKESIREVISPNTMYIGTFHTHPYRAEKIEERPPHSFLVGACKPSKADEESDPLEIPFMLDTILTLSNREIANNMRRKYVNAKTCSMVEFQIGKLFFMLSASVRSEKKGFVQDTLVKIEVPNTIKSDLEFEEECIVTHFLDGLL